VKVINHLGSVLDTDSEFFTSTAEPDAGIFGANDFLIAT
jgi:hypothetical protein